MIREWGQALQRMMGEPEQALYERVWKTDAYRKVAPGLRYVEPFLEACAVTAATDRILDVGCGTGRAAKRLMDLGYQVRAVDLAGNCLDADLLEQVPFQRVDVTQDAPQDAEWVFCVDMLEHLPTASVPKALAWLKGTMRKGAFLVIPMFASTCEEGLHKTVADTEWWAEQFRRGGWYEGYHVTLLPQADQRLIVRVEVRKMAGTPTKE